MTKEIQLSRGKVALVSDHQYERVSQFKWWAHLDNSGNWYARGRVNGADILLHRFLTNAPTGMQVDHIDRYTLNCTDDNLRICTRTQNAQNRKKHVTNTSGFTGVHFDNNHKRWTAQICINGKGTHIGNFGNKLDAALAYDAAARKLRGEFAVTNFPAPTGDPTP